MKINQQTLYSKNSHRYLNAEITASSPIVTAQ
jgi:hypothetical protein